MANELTIGKLNTLSLYGEYGVGELLKPLQNEIMLFKTYIAGITHLDDDEPVAELYLNRGDYEWAYECLTRPKKLNSTGLYLLGKMYEEGLYVEKDLEKAIDYYEEAANFFNDYEDEFGHDKYSDLSMERLKILTTI